MAGTTVAEVGAMVDPYAATTLVGQQIGPYRVGPCVGRGGMGEVYQGVHERIGSRVALKVISHDSFSEPQLVGRFYREARVVARIGHEGIVNVFDMLEAEDGRPCLVMELLDGAPLSDVTRQGPVPPQVAFTWLRRFLPALGRAHECGVYHRDLKPSNLFVTRSGRAVILDFGIAKVTESDGVETAKHAVIGTKPYMAPEQVRGFGVDHRSDLFSMAVVIYELLAGHRPFRANDPLKLSAQHTIGPLPLPLGMQIERFIDRALACNPARRFQSAAEMSEAAATILNCRPAPSTVQLRAVSGAAAQTPPPQPESAPATAAMRPRKARGSGHIPAFDGRRTLVGMGTSCRPRAALASSGPVARTIRPLRPHHRPGWE